MTNQQRQNRIPTVFVLLSLLLHLLLLLVPKERFLPAEVPPEPVFVEVRPPEETQDRELDLPIREELETPRETPAKRLAEKDQVVEQETAPQGEDTEDRQAAAARPKPVPQPPPAPPQQPEATVRQEPTPAPPQQPQATVRQEPLSEPAPATPEGWRQPQAQPERELPDLETLTQISPDTLAQLESDWRRKYRQDVTQGDTVWLDTEQDLLHSFMTRFRDNIYLVWNYPDAAAMRGQSGTCLLRITVDRQGNVMDVALMESSGSRILDEEAMRAVREGATYGPLPRAYPNEDLKIMAFFRYHLSGVSYSRRKPGVIY
ncbi:MAG: energy transducer TonB [Desulfuromonadales bacterium]